MLINVPTRVCCTRPQPASHVNRPKDCKRISRISIFAMLQLLMGYFSLIWLLKEEQHSSDSLVKPTDSQQFSRSPIQINSTSSIGWSTHNTYNLPDSEFKSAVNRDASLEIDLHSENLFYRDGIYHGYNLAKIFGKEIAFKSPLQPFFSVDDFISRLQIDRYKNLTVFLDSDAETPLIDHFISAIKNKSPNIVQLKVFCRRCPEHDPPNTTVYTRHSDWYESPIKEDLFSLSNILSFDFFDLRYPCDVMKHSHLGSTTQQFVYRHHSSVWSHLLDSDQDYYSQLQSTLINCYPIWGRLPNVIVRERSSDPYSNGFNFFESTIKNQATQWALHPNIAPLSYHIRYSSDTLLTDSLDDIHPFSQIEFSSITAIEFSFRAGNEQAATLLYDRLSLTPISDEEVAIFRNTLKNAVQKQGAFDDILVLWIHRLADRINDVDEEGRTVLMSAARNAELRYIPKAIKLLIKNMTDKAINTIDIQGWSTLSMALRFVNAPILEEHFAALIERSDQRLLTLRPNSLEIPFMLPFERSDVLDLPLTQLRIISKIHMNESALIADLFKLVLERQLHSFNRDIIVALANKMNSNTASHIYSDGSNLLTFALADRNIGSVVDAMQTILDKMNDESFYEVNQKNQGILSFLHMLFDDKRLVPLLNQIINRLDRDFIETLRIGGRFLINRALREEQPLSYPETLTLIAAKTSPEQFFTPNKNQTTFSQLWDKKHNSTACMLLEQIIDTSPNKHFNNINAQGDTILLDIIRPDNDSTLVEVHHLVETIIHKMNTKSINRKDSSGKNALIHATTYLNHESMHNTIALLIDQTDASFFNEKLSNGISYLMHFIRTSTLTKETVSLAKKIISKMTPDSLAISTESGWNALMLLLEKNADHRYERVAQLMIEKMNAQSLTSQNSDGWNALMVGLSYSFEATKPLQALVDKMPAFGLNQINEDGWTALMMTYMHLDEELPRPLIEKIRAKMSTEALAWANKDGWTVETFSNHYRLNSET